MTIAESIEAVDLLQPEMGGDSLIWDTEVDPDMHGVISYVIGGVTEATWLNEELVTITQIEAGDSCPKCGGQVVPFVFGENQTTACDACGFVGITARSGLP